MADLGREGAPGRRARFVGPSDIVTELSRLERSGLVRLPTRPVPTGERLDPVPIHREVLDGLTGSAARRALGRAAKKARTTEVVWRDGPDELVVDPGRVTVLTKTGAVAITIPVRCDQTGDDRVEVVFAVGSPGRPAGMFAATDGRPRGPTVVVERWADALTALAWSTLLELAESVAAALGRDERGDLLIPGSLVATEEGLEVVPVARHRLNKLQS